MDSISFMWSFLKMLCSLALVLALMLGAMVVIRKYFYPSASAPGGDSLIRIVASRHLGPKSSFLLVEVLDKVLLIGIANQQMSLLTEITSPEALEQLRGRRGAAGAAAGPDSFARCLSLWQKLGETRKGGR